MPITEKAIAVPLRSGELKTNIASNRKPDGGNLPRGGRGRQGSGCEIPWRRTIRRRHSQTRKITFDATAGAPVAWLAVDLWRLGVGDPRRAAPELARLAKRWGGTHTGRWAREEIQELKEEMLREANPDDGPC